MKRKSGRPRKEGRQGGVVTRERLESLSSETNGGGKMSTLL